MANILKRVIHSMESLAPLSLAERAWDNVGVLVEAPIPRPNSNSVFLTIDLTTHTLSEALSNPKVGVIVAYHPPIFKGFKRLNLNDVKQKIVLDAIANGISIYSPHTSLDNCWNGVNDWLGKGLGDVERCLPINVKEDVPEGHEGCGSGRIVTLKDPISLNQLISKVKAHLRLKYIRVAKNESHSKNSDIADIKTIAICAGSGSSVLNGVPADIYLTGEMSHHELLACTADNISVILGEHSNTERLYLEMELMPYLKKHLNLNVKQGEEMEVIVSKLDRDPIEII